MQTNQRKLVTVISSNRLIFQKDKKKVKNKLLELGTLTDDKTRTGTNKVKRTSSGKICSSYPDISLTY